MVNTVTNILMCILLLIPPSILIYTLYEKYKIDKEIKEMNKKRLQEIEEKNKLKCQCLKNDLPLKMQQTLNNTANNKYPFYLQTLTDTQIIFDDILKSENIYLIDTKTLTIINNYIEVFEVNIDIKSICSIYSFFPSSVVVVGCNKHDEYDLACLYCLLDKALTSGKFKIVKKETTNN